LVAVALLCAVSAQAELNIGDKAGTLLFKDIRYLPRTLQEVGEANYYVLFFMTNACPLARRYFPRVAELDQEYAEKGVKVVGVNVGPSETIMDMAWHGLEFDIHFPLLKDMDGETAKALGITRTPEVVILDKEMVLRYRGRVDDQYRLGGVRPEVSREDLKLALDELLAGKEVSEPETKSEGCSLTFPTVPEPETPVTFSEHIAPIMFNNCTSCHRDGGGAPFPLSTYEEVSGKARMIEEVVREGRMPPWYAHPQFGTFENAMRLSDEEKMQVRQWLAAGKPQGDPAKMPEAPKFVEGEWQIEPDLILTVANPVALPAEGYVPYKYLFLPHKFEHDTWVQGIEIKPSNRDVVHHANLIFTKNQYEFTKDSQFLTGYVPGGLPAVLDANRALLIPKGALLALQVHYVTTGRVEKDQISVGLRFAKERIQKRSYYTMFEVLRDLKIPPYARAHKVVDAHVMDEPTTGIALFSHMHLRGRDMTFYAHYPDGETEVLMSLPNYNFNWQLTYMYPPGEKQIPAGTKIECVAHYDNSPFNPYNPDPSKTIEHGPQTIDEMFNGFYVYTKDNEQLNLDVDPNTGAPLTEVAAAE
jgi:thiol-disulfide isomerase/thioredoxin